MPTKINTHIRWMIRRDLKDVLFIEQASFSNAWSEQDYLDALRQRNCIGMVAEYDDAIVGAYLFEMYKNRLVIINFAVHPEFRRQGVGMRMVEKLVGKLSPMRRNFVNVHVRDSNLPAQLFFKACGFKAKEIIRDYYEDTSDDAYLMQYRIPKDGLHEADI